MPIKLQSSGGGDFTLNAAASASNRTITLPDATTTLVGTDAIQTLTNKTLATPSITGATTSTGSFTESSRAAAMGYWINVAYNAANFTANGSMTWSVESGDQLVYKYTLIGKTMILQVYIATSTVGGTVNTELRIAIPGGYTAASGSVVQPASAYQSAWVAGGAGINPTYIAFYINPNFVTNWALSTNLTAVAGTFTFEVN